MPVNKIKILHFFASWEKGGAEIWLLRFLEKFIKDNRFENHVGALYAKGVLKDKFKALGLPVINLNMKYLFDPKGISDLKRLLRTEQYDIIHTHLLKTDLVFQYATLNGGAKLVTTKHNNFYKAGFLNSIIENKINRNFDYIFCVSRDVYQAVTQAIRVPEEKIGIAYPIPVSKESIPVKRLTKDKTSLIIGTLGRLHPVKGLKYLLEAWPLVLKKAPQAKLLIAGPDSYNYKKVLLKKIQDKYITESISWLGEIEDIPAYFSKIDIFCTPSISEGFPLSVIEAMSAGKPVIASETGGIPEQVIHMQNGLLFKVGDINAIADAVLYFANNLYKIEEMGKKSIERVVENFNIENSIEKIKQVYLNLCPGE